MSRKWQAEAADAAFASILTCWVKLCKGCSNMCTRSKPLRVLLAGCCIGLTAGQLVLSFGCPLACCGFQGLAGVFRLRMKTQILKVFILGLMVNRRDLDVEC